MLYNVDDLRAQAEQNRQARQKGVDPALAIIERETAACLRRAAAPAARRRRAPPARRPRRRDPPARARRASSPPCPDLTDADREAIAHASRLQNQFLHHPRAALRSAAADPPHEHPHPLLTAVRHLFGLAD